MAWHGWLAGIFMGGWLVGWGHIRGFVERLPPFVGFIF
jgi:hypothetical protein